MATEDIAYLSRLLLDLPRLRREAVKRRKVFDERSINPEELARYLAETWQVERELKRKIKIRREKPLDERLENRFWMLLFKMGYPEMNEGRAFTIRIERRGAEPLRKQIDVFAKDDETVIVAECKASEKMVKRSLQKDIEEFANLRGPIAAAIHKHYGGAFRPKIVWMFVTENIIWSKPDRERAAGGNIRVVTERELRYYSQIAEHLGKAARYQFLAEFLKDQAIQGLAGRRVPAIRGKLGGRKFYCFVTTPRNLLKISFVNHRSLNDPEGVPTYQRIVSRSRIRDIASYIANGGYFPNNLLVNFSRAVRFDKILHNEEADVSYGELYLPDRYQSAWIIDGQHRLYGFSPLADSYLDQNVIVVAFEMMPTKEEANLFVTINHEQKPVPKHLLDDLEGELKWGSAVPSERIGALAARLINVLGADVGEPFFNRITQQGISSTNKMCLTIPAIKDALRRSGLLGKALLNDSNYELGALCGASDVETLDRARSGLNLYFSHLRNVNLSQWEKGREGHLCTNVAVQGYILLLASLIRYWEANTATDARQMDIEDVVLEIEEYLTPVLKSVAGADDARMKQQFQVPFGSGGPREYYYRLCALVKTTVSDFEPEGMEEWEAEQSEERIGTANRQIGELQVKMQQHIFGVFRRLYGEARDAYWDRGVSDKAIKAEAYKRSLDYEGEDRLPLEAYLDVIDLKKIVENRQNWAQFKDVFNIADPGDRGLAKNLRWMERINELRRVSAHPSEKRRYKAEDFEYIEFIYGEFCRRLESARQNQDGVAAEGREDVGRHSS